MTRPFFTARARVGEVLPYPAYDRRLGAPARLIGGTILWAGLPQTLSQLKKLPVPPAWEMSKQWLHSTVSLPPGLTLDREQWMDVWHVCFTAMEWHSRAFPWIAFKHAPKPAPEQSKDNAVEHAHAVLLSSTWSGRQLDRSNMQRRCDAAEQAIRHHLGIPQPPRPAMAISIPVRRNIGRMDLAEAISKAFRLAQPCDLDELRLALADYGVSFEISPNTHDVDSYAFRYENWRDVRGKSISDDLTPTAINARFELNKKLRVARAQLEFRRFLAAYAMIQTAPEPITKEPEYGRYTAEAHGHADHAPGLAANQDEDGTAAGSDPSYFAGRISDEGQHRNPAALACVAGNAAARGNDAGTEPGHDTGSNLGQAGQDRGDGEKIVAGSGETDGRDHGHAQRTDVDEKGHGDRERAARGVFWGRGLGRRLKMLRAFAEKHGFAMRVRFDELAKALRLHFADKSALWISDRGARLATMADLDSQAHRFVRLYAGEAGWSLLIDANWPVPRPSARGDWLCVRANDRRRLRRELIHAASCRLLQNSPPLHERAGAPGVGMALPPLWPIPGATGSRGDLLLMSKESVSKTTEELERRIKEVANLAGSRPELMVLWFKADSNDPVIRTASKVVDALRDILARRSDAPSRDHDDRGKGGGGGKGGDGDGGGRPAAQAEAQDPPHDPRPGANIVVPDPPTPPQDEPPEPPATEDTEGPGR